MRAELEATFRNFDFERFDNLEQCALARYHAHTRWRASSKTRRDLSGLRAQVAALRARLLVDARSLVAHDLIDARRLARCGARGYRAMASDVLTIVNVFKDSWSAISGKTPLTLYYLNSAATHALELLSEVGRRQQTPDLAAKSGSFDAKRMLCSGALTRLREVPSPIFAERRQRTRSCPPCTQGEVSALDQPQPEAESLGRSQRKAVKRH